MYFRLIYCSKPTATVTLPMVQDIVAKAQAFNNANRITGALFFNHEHFLQCLEGDRTTINKLYHERIAKDPRHSDICLLAAEETTEFYFTDWSMALITQTSTFKNLFVKYSGMTKFSPTTIASSDVLDFFLEARAALRNKS